MASQVSKPSEKVVSARNISLESPASTTRLDNESLDKTSKERLKELEDPRNPLNWSSARKWSIILLISSITFVLYAGYQLHGKLKC
jgi:hypothetical protein